MLSIDPITGKVTHTNDVTQNPELRSLLGDLDPLDRLVVRWLYGIGSKQLDAETIAARLNTSEDDIWICAARATESLGRSVVLELAA